MSREKPSSIRRCAACGAQNRIPVEHLADAGKCGACKARLPPASEPIDADTALFDAIVGSAKVPVLVDFWAPWCGPCRMAAPEVKRAAEQTAGRALVLKVNSDEQPALAGRYGVSGIPNFVVLRGGNVVKQQAGLVRSGQLVSWLDQAGSPAARSA